MGTSFRSHLVLAERLFLACTMETGWSRVTLVSVFYVRVSFYHFGYR